jgi:hypothetical protein
MHASFFANLPRAASLHLGWFQFAQPLTAKALLTRAEDNFDGWPARTILILGNSRTFYHDMPDMVRAIADSAHDSQKLEITLARQQAVVSNSSGTMVRRNAC